MTGAKIPVLEIENLYISPDGRGLILYNDGTNFLRSGDSPWTGVSSQVAAKKGATGGRTFLCTPSSLGWLKIHYVSGSTYGPTGASAYIPIFRNLDINKT